MNLLIKNIRLINFKGAKDTSYDLGKNTKVSGCNGIGKSTIATAYYWVLCDKSVELISNPTVKPVDIEECTPRVEITVDVDGRELQIAKEQKIKVKEDKQTGIRKVSATNTYEINSVEKTERDFKAYLTDIGVDFEKLLILSHPDVFVSGMNEKKAREQMRNTLFAMGTDYTDLELAKKEQSTSAVAELLAKGYKIDEIEAMQNATIRKIRENYGKDGEILRAKIEGLENAKVDVEVSDMELGRSATREKLEENQSKIDDFNKQSEEFQNISASIIELKTKQNELYREANIDLIKQKNDLEMQKTELEYKLSILKSKAVNCDNQIERNKQTLEVKNAEIQKLRDDVKIVNEREFDETQVICPYCQQEYQEDKKEEIRESFETTKKERIAQITRDGKAVRSIIDGLISSNASLSIEKADCEKEIKVLCHSIEEVQSKLDSLPENIDVSDTEEYQSIQKQIDDAQAIINKGFNSERKQELNRERSELQEQLLEFEKQLAKAENNVQIDEQISELLEKQREYEQTKADAEKILEQLKALSKIKNELLVKDINSHFEIVRWVLFDYQKNGDYKEVCIPTIDGKRFGESANTGREVLAKLDIINGLQKFYEQSYPVFLDNAECLSDDTRKRIEANCQMIYLSVSEDEKIKVEVM